MNENTKTGIFWGIAVVMLAVALFVAWPMSSERSTDSPIAGRPLFEEFQDPLVAANMRIVSFDEVLGQLNTFEVRKDRETGMWTIPSRQGYPADAVAQMRDAANSLIALTILDIQTENAEDHDSLGVVEPKLEDLEIGDDGVGRLVTFKDESQKTIASLIIGYPVEGEEGKIYVRKPGQDPVYVVRLDDSPLSTRFENWIEEDLLQLSSIDIRQIEIKDYNASLGLGGVSLTRNYTATVSVDGSDWTVDSVLVFDPNSPLAPPKESTIDGDKQPNQTKLNEMKNALDDLKIVDVVRKPEGLSANLKADKDLVADNDAIRSLAQRGFIPLELGPGGETEVISANGELAVTLQDGVRYILRFGNVSGISDEDDEEGESLAGVNRYLLVTTEIDESRFPTPDLQPIPETLEELEKLLAGDEVEPAEPTTTPTEPADQSKSDPADEPPADPKGDPATEPATETTDESPADPANGNLEPEPQDASSSDEPNGEVETSGGGEASGSGPGQVPENPGPGQVPENPGSSDDLANTETGSGDEAGSNQEAASNQEASSSNDESGPNDDPGTEPKDQPEPSSPPAAETAQPAGEEPLQDDSDEPMQDAAAVSELDGLTEEEKQERLEAEQEKITKENQRKLDARKDQIEAANRRVRDLNARFADWYYVIPEATYQKLRIGQSELFEAKSDEAPESAESPLGIPGFNMPMPGRD